MCRPTPLRSACLRVPLPGPIPLPAAPNARNRFQIQPGKHCACFPTGSMSWSNAYANWKQLVPKRIFRQNKLNTIESHPTEEQRDVMPEKLRIYNTLSRKKEPFETIEPGKVRMYVCGVTPYSSAHIGHGMSL